MLAFLPHNHSQIFFFFCFFYLMIIISSEYNFLLFFLSTLYLRLSFIVQNFGKTVQIICFEHPSSGYYSSGIFFRCKNIPVNMFCHQKYFVHKFSFKKIVFIEKKIYICFIKKKSSFGVFLSLAFR